MHTPIAVVDLRLKFFEFIFEAQSGYVCIASTDQNHKGFRESFWKWPDQKAELGTYVDHIANTRNVFYGTSLLRVPQRNKLNCLPGNLVWSDLDFVDPEGREGGKVGGELVRPSGREPIGRRRHELRRDIIGGREGDVDVRGIHRQGRAVEEAHAQIRR